MRVKIGKGTARGTVQAPPSKSMANRLLICAGLADGTSVIHGIAPSEDVLATIDCLQALGIRCELEKDTAVVYGRELNELCRDTAADEKTEETQKLEHPVRTLMCRESGSTLRRKNGLLRKWKIDRTSAERLPENLRRTADSFSPG